ncbi:cyclic AMP-dependent transcription factor ATF-2 [Exaiptasia diaphana]|uniref:Cyclic AMP-dependent transcription factor ATF-2 n=1 Tax=Exaiptasia diaphana TaxID=2652724 RepID=A0A913WRT1_EXADI|nr:cyclic AMP-dependent transcription factor ATF-2 [Exaiptasia diaphana]KXJ28093.1 Cyclic AMP-dependent transcription factor ATF-2 [Exaiptasia diaphana]
MESDEKPFVCTSPGCGQRFANNDHLESHKQKHQLSLKLPGIGNLKTSDILGLADQTPTPTRFLENLEKEGLFQDLESNNPFDQEFKRANPNSEATVNPTTNSTVSQDSVIIINSTNHSNIIKPEVPALNTLSTTTKVPPALTIPASKVSTSKAAPVSVLVRVSVPQIPTVIPASIANANMPVPSALPVPGHLTRTVAQSSMPISIPTPAIVTSPITSNPPQYSSAKQRLKEQLRQHNNNNAIHPENIISQAMTEAVDMVTSENHNGVSTVPHVQIARNGGHWQTSEDDAQPKDKKRPRRSQEELDPDERRRKFLERNRAAATRCREKRKIWVQQLEKKADDLSETNSQLQGEISLLKTEVAQLKSLLLAHKDCPVTLAQQKMASQGQREQGHVQVTNSGHVQVTDTPNGPALTISHSDVTAEDVATSALTQMAQRVVIENYAGQASNWPQTE